MLWCNY